VTFVVDRSERGKLALTGAEAKDFLHGQVTNDIVSLTPGTGCYAAFLTHKGKMLGDMRVFDVGDELLLDCERVTLQELFNMIRRYKLGRDVELHKRTLELAELSVIGPDAPRLAGPEEHDNARVVLGGVQAIAVTTDVGTDLFCAAADKDALRAALDFPDGDEAAAEIVRVERGRPRYGIDLDETVMPEEAGIVDRAVSFTKGCFTGQELVARIDSRGGNVPRHLRGVVVGTNVLPPAGATIEADGKAVGTLTSVAESLERRAPVALGYVRRAVDPPADITLTWDGGSAPARVEALPLVR
jgi:tRNA-modifying protein YgfZ